MTKNAQIIATKTGHIGSLVFQNVGKHNALDQQAWLDIPGALEDLMRQNVRAIVVSGHDQSFCAGADISEFDVVRKDAETARVYEKANAEAFAALRNVAVPTIAKIKGFCLGGGFGLAAACDIRLAEEQARFAVPAAKLGLAYPVDAMADIVHAVGAQNAKRLLFTAAQFSADEMLKFGFLSEVHADASLDAAVESLTDEIANLAPLSHRATKASIDAALSGITSREQAAFVGDTTFESQDYAEGRKAFQEKRKAKFKGN